MTDYSEINDFWFSDEVKPLWFRSTPEFDQLLRDRYMHCWEQASQGGLNAWMERDRSALALVIVLDQFPLNMFRGQAKSFQTESMSRDVARHAIKHDFDTLLNEAEKAFLYMPFMHSENILDQEYSVELFEKAGLKDNAKWAQHHREIVRRFGRFPHRNVILGRESTPDEIAYLESDEAFTG